MMDVLDREKPFQCTKCNKKYKKEDDLLNHLKKHEAKTVYPCTGCDKVFLYHATFLIHVRKHTGDKPFKCPKCEKSFSQKGNLKTHINRHLKNEGLDEVAIEMYHQKEKSLTQMIMNTHQRQQIINEQASKGKETFQCPTCCKVFKHQSVMEIHMRSHTGERPYKCTLCDKGFTQQGSLKAHLFRHSHGNYKKEKSDKQKLYCCISCGKSFEPRKGEFESLLDNEERSYKCISCEKMSVQKNDIGNHFVNTKIGNHHLPQPFPSNVYSNHTGAKGYHFNPETVSHLLNPRVQGHYVPQAGSHLLTPKVERQYDQ